MKKYLILGAVAVVVLAGAWFGYKKLNDTDGSVKEQETQQITQSGAKLEKLDISTIRNYRNASIIALSDNSLQTLPAEIGELTQVEIFQIANNQLAAIPAEIGKLSKLKTLDVSNNKLTGVPAEIGKLSKLETLNLSGNQITDLPNELYELKSIQSINLKGNPLSDIHKAKVKQVFGDKAQL